MRLLNQPSVTRAMDWLLDPQYGLGLLLKNVNVLEVNRSYLRARLQTVGVHVTHADLPQGRMQTLEGGEGEPLLFLHGFGVGAVETWSEQLYHFSRHYRVFAPDLFWFGGSEPHQSDAMLNAEEQADAILAYLDARGLESAHVVGLSFGGIVSLWLALKAPERFRSLVLVDSAGLEPTEREETLMRECFDFAEGDVSKLLIPENTEQLKDFLARVFYTPRYIPEFAREQVLQHDFWVHGDKKRAIAQSLQQTFLSREQLSGIEVSTKVLWGSYDRLLPASMGWRFSEWLPQASLSLFPQSGHVPPLEQPDEFNRELRAFLR
jgi:pimeloyl-ACP methyl ester carboxylesterase